MDKVTVLNVIVLLSSIYIMTLSMLFSCNNMGSTLMFKVFPFFLGMIAFGRGLQLLGWM